MSVAPSVGIGWRHPHYGALARPGLTLGFLEVHSENFFAAGGAALATLLAARRDHAVSLHGVGLALGSAVGIDTWHLDQLSALVERVEPVRVSDHACFARAHRPGTTRTEEMTGTEGMPMHGSDLLPVPFSMAALQVMVANVQRVQDRLRRPLLVENLSAYLRWDATATQSTLSEAQFLSELAARSGCGLLVDVNNLYVNALNAQIAAAAAAGDGHVVADERAALAACHAWIDAIPAGGDGCPVGEIHLAGHLRLDDAHGQIVIDDHGSRVSEAVWALHRHALQRFGPATPALVEWDTNLPPFEVLLAEADRAQEVANLVHAECAV